MRSDGVSGRVNRVVFGSERSAGPAFHAHVKGDLVIGRREGLRHARCGAGSTELPVGCHKAQTENDSVLSPELRLR